MLYKILFIILSTVFATSGAILNKAEATSSTNSQKVQGVKCATLFQKVVETQEVTDNPSVVVLRSIDYSYLETLPWLILNKERQDFIRLLQEQESQFIVIKKEYSQAQQSLEEFQNRLMNANQGFSQHLEEINYFSIQRKFKKMQNDINMIRDHISALERSMERKENHISSPFDVKFEIDSSITLDRKNGKTIIFEIEKIIEDAGIHPDDVLIAYVKASKVDLLRLWGSINSAPEQYIHDYLELERILQPLRLLVEDSLRAITFNQFRKHYNIIRESFTQNQVLVIYELSQLASFSGLNKKGVYVFRNPRAKHEAMVGFISSSLGK